MLGHEIGHVLARHGAERIAGARIAPGLTGAAVLAAYDPADPASRRNPAVAALIGRLIDLRFSRGRSAEADRLGARLAVRGGVRPARRGAGERGSSEAVAGPEKAARGGGEGAPPPNAF